MKIIWKSALEEYSFSKRDRAVVINFLVAITEKNVVKREDNSFVRFLSLDLS